MEYFQDYIIILFPLFIANFLTHFGSLFKNGDYKIISVIGYASALTILIIGTIENGFISLPIYIVINILLFNAINENLIILALGIKKDRDVMQGYCELLVNDLNTAQLSSLDRLNKLRQNLIPINESPFINLSYIEEAALKLVLDFKTVPDQFKVGKELFINAYYTKYKSSGFDEETSRILTFLDFINFPKNIDEKRKKLRQITK